MSYRKLRRLPSLSILFPEYSGRKGYFTRFSFVFSSIIESSLTSLWISGYFMRASHPSESSFSLFFISFFKNWVFASKVFEQISRRWWKSKFISSPFLSTTSNQIFEILFAYFPKDRKKEEKKARLTAERKRCILNHFHAIGFKGIARTLRKVLKRSPSNPFFGLYLFPFFKYSHFTHKNNKSSDKGNLFRIQFAVDLTNKSIILGFFSFILKKLEAIALKSSKLCREATTVSCVCVFKTLVAGIQIIMKGRGGGSWVRRREGGRERGKRRCGPRFRAIPLHIASLPVKQTFMESPI